MRPDFPSSLSDQLIDLKSSSESFSRLYRHLMGLSFPLEVAEILELRSLLNQIIDQEAEFTQEDAGVLMEIHRLEFETLGVAQAAHKDRLARLMAILRAWHVRHRAMSQTRENNLRKALADNRMAQKRSLQYGRACLAPALVLIAAWLIAGPHAWLIKGAALVLGYLFCDHFHSLIALGKEHRLLNNDLSELVATRIPALNWNALIRQVALVLGYGRVRGVEPFMLKEQPEALRA